MGVVTARQCNYSESSRKIVEGVDFFSLSRRSTRRGIDGVKVAPQPTLLKSA